MITISDLHVSFDGAEILHGINAVFPKGKISAIIGPNGCGKSTTLRAVLRMTSEMTGTLTIDGRNLSQLSSTELARKIAYLPQSRNVPDITVERLVLHGRFPYLGYPRRYRKEDHEKVSQALEWVGLTNMSERKMAFLSGGQRQKAYLAMALAQDTDVILMDEPTTFLDIKNQFELLSRARVLADEGKTIIMILHDFDAVLHYADHVILMAQGQVLSAGNAREVLGSEDAKRAFGVTPCFFETDDGFHCFARP